MYKILVFILLALPSYSLAQNTAARKNNSGANQTTIAKDLNVKEFQKQMAARPGTLVDVRTPGEVKKGAIPNSINLDIFDDHFEAKLEQLDKNKPVYVYCAVGGRSAEAMEIMKKKGFVEVYNLSGGYTAWSKTVR